MSTIFMHFRLISVLQHNSFKGGVDTAIVKHSCGNRGISRMHTARFRVRPDGVVVSAPSGQHRWGLQHGGEQRLAEARIAQPAARHPPVSF
jgi:hypothetical protein